MRIVFERYGTVREMLCARERPETHAALRGVIDCAILYKCYLKYNRPNYIKNRIMQVWMSVADMPMHAPIP